LDCSLYFSGTISNAESVIQVYLMIVINEEDKIWFHQSRGIGLKIPVINGLYPAWKVHILLKYGKYGNFNIFWI
jgi:hypothetical protein